MFKASYIFNRPIAPHLLIYIPQLSSLFSIWHRVTGIVLASIISLFLLNLKIYVTSNFFYLIILNKMFKTFIYITWMIHWFYLVILLFFIYHMLNGVRHIIWDFGLFLNIKFLPLFSSIAFFILSLILIINLI